MKKRSIPEQLKPNSTYIDQQAQPNTAYVRPHFHCAVSFLLISGRSSNHSDDLLSTNKYKKLLLNGRELIAIAARRVHPGTTIRARNHTRGGGPDEHHGAHVHLIDTQLTQRGDPQGLARTTDVPPQHDWRLRYTVTANDIQRLPELPGA